MSAYFKLRANVGILDPKNACYVLYIFLFGYFRPYSAKAILASEACNSEFVSRFLLGESKRCARHIETQKPVFKPPLLRCEVTRATKPGLKRQERTDASADVVASAAALVAP